MKKHADIVFFLAILLGVIIFFIPLIFWWNHPEVSQMEILLKFRFLYVIGIVFIGFELWIMKASVKSSRVPKMKNPPPPPGKRFPDPDVEKEALAFLEKRKRKQANCDHKWRIGVCEKCGKASWR